MNRGFPKTHFSTECFIAAICNTSVRITERGSRLLAGNPPKITTKLLAQFPEFREFSHRDSEGESGEKVQVTETETHDEQTPEETLERSYSELQNALAADILDAVKKSSASFFERLVVKLLVTMGYGGSVADAGKAVGKSGDDGVDGIIKADKLGLDTVFIQAKRWKDTVVGRPVVQAFAGSLEGHRARKGILITTSTFSQDAREYVQRIEKKIILVDGKMLAALLIEHDVGVTTVRDLKLKRLDHDFFEAES